MAFQEGEAYAVPDIVRQFVHYFYRHIRERNIPEIQSMYEVSFLKLSDRYYKNVSWPHVDLIADVVDQDHVFCLLYKEMYYRHLYARCAPDLRQRCESWDNYCSLFGVLLHSNVNMQLPNIWLWDMIDEFCYQFQSFCQYRGKLIEKTPEELALLKQCDKVWNVLEVLNVLQALVDKSSIISELEADGGAKFCATEGFTPNASNVLRLLGYFSLGGLLRVHCLVGDYASGLRALYPLNLHITTNLYSPKIIGAHITLFYYGAFAYLMLRRYVDAGRLFNTILMYINRVKQYHARSAQYEQILNKNEQMYSLLAITVSLCPAVNKLLDENVATQLRERHNDDINRMTGGDRGTFDDRFSYACPKFITSTPPSYDNPTTNTSQTAFRTQLNLFLAEVRSQAPLPSLKAKLSLYSSILLSKLADIMDVDEASLRTALTCLKNKTYGLKWAGGPDMLSGVPSSSSDVDFFVDVDAATGSEVIVVSDNVHSRHHAEFLARHITKFEEIIRDIEAPVAAAPPAGATIKASA